MSLAPLAAVCLASGLSCLAWAGAAALLAALAHWPPAIRSEQTWTPPA